MRDEALQNVIARATGYSSIPILSRQSLSGGSIHRVERIELTDGRCYCVKSNSNAADMFAQEAYGLAALAQVGCLLTPQVFALESLAIDSTPGTGTSSHGCKGEQCLVMEVIEPGKPTDDYWSCFGRQLAEHHRRGQGRAFGWSSDNYIGSTVQKNESRDSWLEFFGECRLGYQLKLARQRGLGSGEFYRLASRMLDRLDRWLPADPIPCLVHGDLWQGNLLANSAGQPVVIDPAVYYGDREVELAMPLLFGGFPPGFFEAYDEAWQLDADWRERVELYKLYHLLNHLNLFGAGYLDSCLEIVRRFGS